MRRLFIMHDGRFFRKHRSQLELRCRVWELPLPPELPDLARWQRRRRDIDDGAGDPDIAGRPVFHRCIRPGPEVRRCAAVCAVPPLAPVEASGPGGRGLGANGVIGGDLAYAGRAAAMP